MIYILSLISIECIANGAGASKYPDRPSSYNSSRRSVGVLIWALLNSYRRVIQILSLGYCGRKIKSPFVPVRYLVWVYVYFDFDMFRRGRMLCRGDGSFI